MHHLRPGSDYTVHLNNKQAGLASRRKSNGGQTVQLDLLGTKTQGEALSFRKLYTGAQTEGLSIEDTVQTHMTEYLAHSDISLNQERWFSHRGKNETNKTSES